jgi:hypothetical protein
LNVPRATREALKVLNRRQFLATMAVVAAGSAGCLSSETEVAAQPLRQRAFLGLNHPMSSVKELERALGFTFPVLGGLYYTFDTVWRRHVQELAPADHRVLLVCWMPKLQDRTVALSEVSKGWHDRQIDQMLDGMRSFPGRVVCRWGHEANGNTYPWSAATAGSKTSPEDYVAAWQYVIHRERSMPGRSNISWFWCPSAVDLPSADGQLYPMEDYWPGESWVDLIGCDVYNEPGEWRSFDEIVQAPYQRITKLSSKPFWIGELGCHEPRRGQLGTKGRWLEDMLGSIQFPRLRAVCYFDYDARRAGRADWRLDSTQATFDAFKAALHAGPMRE